MRNVTPVFVLALATISQGWQTQVLDSANADGGVVYAGSGNTPVGFVNDLPEGDAAVLWGGLNSSFTNLKPGHGNARAFGAAGNQQVGRLMDLQFAWTYAALWNGTPESYVDLHPPEAFVSVATGTNGTRQVGMVYFEDQHAGYWEGSASSWVDLGLGYATSIHGDLIGGAQRPNGINEAVFWNVDSDSVTNLHPAGWQRSIVNAMSESGQSGTVFATSGQFGNAAFWSGTSSSFINLHPNGWDSSEVSGAVATYQVGHVRTGASAPGNVMHAALWSGTQATFFDLHSALPSEYVRSTANGAWIHEGTLYVGGSASVQFGPTVPMIWSTPVPEPASMLVLGAGLLALARRRRKSD